MLRQATIRQSLLDKLLQLSLSQQQELLNFAEFLVQKTPYEFSEELNNQLPENQVEWKKFIRETSGTWPDMPTCRRNTGRMG